MQQINIAILDHNPLAVRDQLCFMEKICQDLDISLTISKKIDKSLKNIILEGVISENYVEDLEYIQKNPTRVAMLLTEHLEYKQNTFLLNGISVKKEMDFNVDPNIYVNRRFSALLNTAEKLTFFITCGNLPDTSGYRKLLPNGNFAELPWPTIHFKNNKPKYEKLLFSVPNRNLLTPFRKTVLREIQSLGYEIKVVDSKTIKETKKILQKYQGSLDIQKTKDWKFDSPMRTFMALVSQRPKITIRNSTEISQIGKLFDVPFHMFNKLSKVQKLQLIDEIPEKYNNFYFSQDFKSTENLKEWINS